MGEVAFSHHNWPRFRTTKCMLLQHFIWGLKPESAKFLDIAVVGASVYTTLVEGKKILAKILCNLEDYQPIPLENLLEAYN